MKARASHASAAPPAPHPVALGAPAVEATTTEGTATGAEADAFATSESLQRLESVLLDARTSQSLEPIRLPHKLRDRIEKAQRRAAAAKDGVSIFTSSTDQQQQTEVLGSPGGPKASTPGPTASSALGQGRFGSILLAADSSSSQQQQQQAKNMLLLREKIHLPEVVLSHKMHDFEGKTNANSLLVDPLDNSLNRLSLEEKEHVMQRMQEKVQQITKDIGDNFLRLKDELDANGIFDSTANYQRAQAICLVDLQKQCRLERLRDEAIKEVVDGDSGGSGDPGLYEKRRRRISGKLSLLLAQSNQLGHEGSGDGGNRVGGGGAASRRSTPATGKRAPLKKKKSHLGQNLPKLSVERSNQQSPEHESAGDGDERQPHGRNTPADLVRRTGRVEKSSRSSHRAGAPKDDRSGAGPGIGVGAGLAGDRGEDALSHHPHIAQVLQQMASGGAFVSTSSSSRSTSNGNTGSLADVDDSNRPKSAAEQWTERSKSHETIAARTAEVVRNRTERVRWDSLSHFTRQSANLKRVISEALHQKLVRRSKSMGGESSKSEASSNIIDRSSARGGEPTGSEKRNRASALRYASVQEQIRRRLQREKKKALSPAKAPRSKPNASGGSSAAAAATPIGSKVQAMAAMSPSHGNSRNSSAEPLFAPEKRAVSSRKMSLSASASAPSLATERAAGTATTVSLSTATIAPAPALGLSFSVSDLHLQPAADANIHTKLRSSVAHGSRDAGRNSVVERTIRSSQSRSRQFRKESLVGAPVLTDFSTIDHHSNARMDERRYSAQTWAWHHPSLIHKGCGGPESRDDDDDSKNGDTFGDTIDEEGNEDDGENAHHHDDDSRDTDIGTDDGASSVVYSFCEPDTARSSRSIATIVHAGSARARKKLRNIKRNGKLRVPAAYVEWVGTTGHTHRGVAPLKRKRERVAGSPSAAAVAKQLCF